VTTALYAAVICSLFTFGGCLFGHWQGRKTERAAWNKMVSALYRTAKDPGEFRVEVVTKAQSVRKQGWRNV
jgi:hypothetical protein